MRKCLILLLILSLGLVISSCQSPKSRKNKEERRSDFKVDKLTEFAIKEILKFSKAHQDETFYGFASDANMLCLNSIEQFDITLKDYQEQMISILQEWNMIISKL